MKYHIAQNGIQHGELPEEEIISRMRSGELSPGALCWAEGMADWQPLSEKFSLPAAVAVSAPSGAAFNPYSPPASIITAEQSAPGLGAYAGFWLRLVAYIIDYILVNVAALILGFALGIMMVFLNLTDESTLNIVGGILGIVVSWLYFALMESSANQATLGKMALSLVVTNEQGGRISFGQATGRYFAKILSALILLIGFMMCGWTERKQCLHDQLAGCLVYRKVR